MSDTHDGATRSLPLLRAVIDGIDHDILRLIARRMGVVAEVAAHKRQHGIRIRDFERKRQIIDDRRDCGQRLGIPPDAVESLYRVMLWASRERQAALRAEVPPTSEPRTVAIVGGAGGIGSLLGRLFSDLGHVALIADLDTPLTPRQAAEQADVVVISVPIADTVDVIRQVGPAVRADGLLMDVTSIKDQPVAAMLQATSAAVVGAHPLFGPDVHSVQGQRMVLCRGRGDQWFDWVDQMFRARGLVTTETTPQDHDRAMAVVQVLTHFMTEVSGLAMQRMAVPLDDVLEFTSPIYLIELMMTGRHFAQSPALYANIQMSNPQTPAVTAAVAEAVAQWRQTLDNGDVQAFERVFGEVSEFFGPLAGRAMEQSSFLIDRIVERSG